MRMEERPMQPILQQLSEALKKIDRPGLFCVSGSVPAVLPGLEVDGLGSIGLPLSASQANELKALCQQAPYGKGEQTLVDTSVRRVWRLEPSHFALINPDWKRFIQDTVGKIQEVLGLETQKLESHLYDLLLYEPGSFFLPHRDGEKLDRMVATLVIVLPSAYEGGELVVRHDGQEQVVDFASVANSAFHTHFAAFYADCEHEIRPLRSGYRLCLVYNLTLAKSKTAITAPRDSEHIERITPLISEWSLEESARKLAILLEHEYTPEGLAWDALKGVDRVKARVLAEAARRAGCKAFLTALTLHEAGSAENAGDSYHHGRRRWYDDNDEDGPYEMGEVFESSLTGKPWTDSDGNRLPIEELYLEEDELLDAEALRDVDPEEEFEGYTGNAGMTLDHWYRHAAIVVWPEKWHFEILCDANSPAVVPLLNKMARQWRSSPDDAALKHQCLDLAAAILATWPANPYGHVPGDNTDVSELLKALAQLDDPALLRSFFADVMIKDVAVAPGKSLVTVCQKHGWETFQQELLALMRSTNAATLERNVGWLEQICVADPRVKDGRLELCTALAEELIGVLEKLDRAADDWRAEEINRGQVLAGLARALLATGQADLLRRLADHTLEATKKYPLTEAHVPALLSLGPLLEKNLKSPCVALSRWLAACREKLESLTAIAPQKPADSRRPAAISCRCADCAELKRFLASGTEPVFRFSARQDRRSHLEQSIRTNRCDLDLKTERGRSPHTLVCTKNLASYQQALKEYKQNKEHYKGLLAIEADLLARGAVRMRR
jgi:hypothetical protein